MFKKVKPYMGEYMNYTKKRLFVFAPQSFSVFFRTFSLSNH